MIGQVLVPVAQDILDHWDEYGPRIREYAADVATRQGGELLDGEPQFTIRVDNLDGADVIFGMRRS